MTNPYFIFWIVWILGGVGVEFWALFKSHRHHSDGAKGVDTLSSFTQWLVRAHDGNADWSHYLFIALWGFLAAWFPYHILS